MGRKICGILIVGLLIATIVPVGSSIAQTIDEKDTNTLPSSQIEIKIKGGWGILAIIKNIGTTDLNDTNMRIVLDGRLIFPGWKDRIATMDFEAGKTHWVIFPVRGFGVTNIELTVDTTTAAASGMVLGSFVFGVK
jgi:hypothetical protein